MTGFDHFNVIGPIYDWIFGRGKVDHLVALTDISGQTRLLDIGGGTGRVSEHFQGQVKNIQVVDSARNMLKEARDRDLACVLALSECLPYRGRSYDRIIMVDALHHVADQMQTLREITRLLAPGGIAIIEEPDIHNFLVKIIALGEKIMLMRSHFLKPVRIAEMVLEIGGSDVVINKKKGIAWVIITRHIE